ncbi:MAG TPA: thioredoxin [Chloroflexi bacterium]|jgi:thioredoxin 1|nr:thioredoxin [Chloroflexota bacterium]
MALTEVTDASFDQDVLQAKLPTLVDFWAEWCGPCRMMAPALEKLAEERAGSLQIVKIDVQTNTETPVRYDVMNLPTLLLFVNGELKERIAGHVPVQRIVNTIAPYINS